MKRKASISIKDASQKNAGPAVSGRLSGRNRSPVKIIQRVLPLGNAWVVKSDTSRKFTVVTETQKEAIDIAKSIAKNQRSELIIHTKDGTVKSSINYAVSADSKKAK